MKRRSLSFAIIACMLLPSLASASHGNMKISVLYNKRFTRAVGDRPADGGRGRVQPGETWDGTAPLPAY